jgi:hypothetical protein
VPSRPATGKPCAKVVPTIALKQSNRG